jgi:hypothetical protein
MEKNIKDYLHLYKGCKCHTPDGIMEMSYVEDGSANWPVWFDEKCNEANSEILSNDGCCAKGYKYNQVKPILRPLSDMTEEEAKIYFGISESAEVYKKNMYDDHSEFLYRWEDRRRKYNTSDGMAHSAVGIAHNCENADMTPTQFLFLLSKHFDLFGLIEAGLAIDATKQNTNL